MTKYDFEQMLAESKIKLGFEMVALHLEDCARLFGWPIPPERYEQVIFPLACAITYLSGGGSNGNGDG